MKRKKIIAIDAISLELFGEQLGVGFGRGIEKQVLGMLSPEEREILEDSIDSIGKILMQIAQKNEKFEAWIQGKENEKDCENCDKKERCEVVKSAFEKLMGDLRR